MKRGRLERKAFMYSHTTIRPFAESPRFHVHMEVGGGSSKNAPMAQKSLETLVLGKYLSISINTE